ncbi:hypothetical protein GALL_528220 [mine drainage metagenome]|uniref:Uncharacterized protein n=1 Tax=mine drainage metagenome TaxID=410659 RepID=A0A1J5P3F5_9ZZZZ
MIQAPASLLDQRLIVDGTLAAIAEMGIQVHLRSIFLNGLLLLPPDRAPNHLKAAAARISRARRLIAEGKSDPLQAALGPLALRNVVAFRDQGHDCAAFVSHRFKGDVGIADTSISLGACRLETNQLSVGGCRDGIAKLRLQFGCMAPPLRLPERLADVLVRFFSRELERPEVPVDECSVRRQDAHELECLLEDAVEFPLALPQRFVGF